MSKRIPIDRRWEAGEAGDKILSQPRSRMLTIRAVGDIMLIGRAAAALEQRGCEHPFGPISKFIQLADLAFGNLEMPICSDSRCTPHFPDVCPAFRCPPQTAEALKVTGFSVINWPTIT